jgi:hypothetical protein
MNVAQTIANLILQSAQIHSASYDSEAADSASKKADLERANNPDNIYAGLVDYNQFYRMTLGEAVTTACKRSQHEELFMPIYLLVQLGWNDALDWANENK